MSFGKNLRRMAGLLFVVGLLSANIAAAAEAESIEEAFRQGKISGEIGSYFEFTNKDADDADFGWSNAYFTFKYETLSWNNLQMGARFFAHGDLYNDHDDGVTDPFDVDIESRYTLPELYLNYSFAEASSIRAGRWNHKKITHIDDAQSEGGYVQYKEIENLELLVGAMTRYAEIDYDDSEDFGRNNDSQDLDSNDTFGDGSAPVMSFVEVKFQPIEMVTLNPFYMGQNDYASVMGLDTTVKGEWEEYEVEYGGMVRYFNVKAEIDGRDDANVFGIMPFIKKGPVKLDFCYSKFDDGDALNHPGWLVDSLSLVDQDSAQSNAGAEVFESRIKWAQDKWWASFAYATANYDASSSEGDGYKDYELQAGYNFTDSLDLNLRYFMVSFDNIDDKDYNKIESRLRFKF